VVCDPCPACPPQNVTKIIQYQTYPTLHIICLSLTAIAIILYAGLLVGWCSQGGNDAAGYMLAMSGMLLLCIMAGMLFPVMFPYQESCSL